MRLKNESPEESETQPVIPCAKCGEPSVADQCWNVWLCPAHWEKFYEEAPDVGEIERLALPTEIEKRHIGEFMSMTILMPGIIEEKYKNWLNTWMKS